MYRFRFLDGISDDFYLCPKLVKLNSIILIIKLTEYYYLHVSENYGSSFHFWNSFSINKYVREECISKVKIFILAFRRCTNDKLRTANLRSL